MNRKYRTLANDAIHELWGLFEDHYIVISDEEADRIAETKGTVAVGNDEPKMIQGRKAHPRVLPWVGSIYQTFLNRGPKLLSICAPVIREIEGDEDQAQAFFLGWDENGLPYCFTAIVYEQRSRDKGSGLYLALSYTKGEYREAST